MDKIITFQIKSFLAKYNKRKSPSSPLSFPKLCTSHSYLPSLLPNVNLMN